MSHRLEMGPANRPSIALYHDAFGRRMGWFSREFPSPRRCSTGVKPSTCLNACTTSWISSNGRFIAEFERAFARYCGVKHAIATNNGTSALHLALVALGLQPDDEVIVPTLTYIASANAVRYCNAKPVFVDNDIHTFNIDPEEIVAKITPRTKAIMPVHLYGHPVDLDPILEIANDHGLFVVEDAAEAIGAKYKGRTIGGHGNCATFSFFGNKIITTGEGGMVTTNDDALAERASIVSRSRGRSPNADTGSQSSATTTE